MNKMKLVVFSISFFPQIGDITDKKITSIAECLKQKGYFSNYVQVPASVIFITDDPNENIIISSNRIAYNKSGNSVTIDIEKIYNVFKIVFDALMLDEEVNAVIDLQWIVENNKSFIKSRTTFDEKFSNILANNYPQIQGVGYRFMIDVDGVRGDLRIEPLIKDDSFSFIQLVMNYANQNIRRTCELSQNELNSIADKYGSVIDKLL